MDSCGGPKPVAGGLASGVAAAQLTREDPATGGVRRDDVRNSARMLARKRGAHGRFVPEQREDGFQIQGIRLRVEPVDGRERPLAHESRLAAHGCDVGDPRARIRKPPGPRPRRPLGRDGRSGLLGQPALDAVGEHRRDRRRLDGSQGHPLAARLLGR